MQTIWKFVLEAKDICTVEMPVEAEILAVQVQSGQVCMWALVDDQVKTERRIFAVYGTGYPVSENLPKKYIDTFQLMGGKLIFHVFEICKKGVSFQ